MESAGAISEVEWSSFNGLCYEEADFMAQLLGNCSFPNEIPSSFPISVDGSDVQIGGVDQRTRMSSDENYTNMYSFPRGRISYNEARCTDFISSSRHGSFHPGTSHQLIDDGLITMDYCMMEGKDSTSPVLFLSKDVVAEGGDFFIQDVSNDSFKSDEKEYDEGKTLRLGMVPLKEDKIRIPSAKRTRIPGELSTDQVNPRNVKLKKSVKPDHAVHESNDNNSNSNWTSWCSMDGSNASLELNEGVTSSSVSKDDRIHISNGKTRASRGSATDPQSIYARVDISTMLDEAVQYVKFLQLQIKLLSSDDLWMYAPIAYNGMDIGLDIKIPLPR